MIKAHKKFKIKHMRRTSRVFLNDLNSSKVKTTLDFLTKSRNGIQYFTDLFWQRGDFSSTLADKKTIHRGIEKMEIPSSRLAQCLAKQAKEIVRGTVLLNGSKPQVKKHTLTLDYRFIQIEPFKGHFDYAIKLGGAGVPKVLLPVHSTKHLNNKLKDGWKIGKSIRLGQINKKIFIDFLLEKPLPKLKQTGKVVGLDSNYKNGLVLSDGQQVGQNLYSKIATFEKRQKHTYQEAKSITFQAIKQIDLTKVKMLVVEDLRYIRNGTRGKFPRSLNRRLSHWLFTSITNKLNQRCEEEGVQLQRKSPWKTSQRCSICGKWDKRNRRSDRFLCIHCKNSDHADFNAAKNLEFLGLAGIYSFRLLEKLKTK